MKYNHAVKYNGIVYPTGADVPVEDKKEDAGIASNSGEANENLDDDEVKVEKEAAETETDINEKATKKK